MTTILFLLSAWVVASVLVTVALGATGAALRRSHRGDAMGTPPLPRARPQSFGDAGSPFARSH